MKEQTYIQKFYLYMNLTKPSERLILSYSQTSLDGKPLRPAYLVRDIRRLFPGIPVREESKKKFLKKELTHRTGLEYLAQGLQGRAAGVDDAWKELYTWYFQSDDREKVLRLVGAAFCRKGQEAVTEETARLLYGEHSRPSVTRLERFAACAYAHFLSYGLRLSEREQYQFESLDWGNIAHRSMEIFSRKTAEKKQDWQDMEEEERNRLIDSSVEESIVDYGNTILYSSARNEYLITRIKKLIRRSVWALTKQMEQGDFRLQGYELNFGSGKIDHVDTCEDEGNIYVKVTDYKTGRTSFDITAYYHGLQLQLPVYLNAAMAIEKKKNPDKNVIPAGVFYYHMEDPIVGKEEEEEKREKRILKELRLDGVVSADETVLSHMEHKLDGASCYFPVGRNKDGSLSKNSKALSPEEFDLFLTYAKDLERRIREQMAKGQTDPSPYEMGERTGCDYCAYHDICGFDPRIRGYRYREMEKYSREEVLEKMKTQIGGLQTQTQEVKGHGSSVDRRTAESD